MTDNKDNHTIDIEEAIEIESNALEIAQQQQHSNALEVQQKYGDNLPYQRDRVVNEAKFFMVQSADAMLQAGKRLVQIKENEPHGEFINVIEDTLKLNKRTAQAMMQASIKFLKLDGSKAQTFTHLAPSKLFELMTLDDELLNGLAEGETVAGITLDAIDTMSVRELKAALKEAREDSEAARKRSAEKVDENDKLKDQIDKLKKKRKIELEKNDIISILAEYKETWLETSTRYTSAMCDTKALLAKANEDNLPPSFYQQIAVEIIELRDQLNDILSLLPSDIPSSTDAAWVMEE